MSKFTPLTKFLRNACVWLPLGTLAGILVVASLSKGHAEAVDHATGAIASAPLAPSSPQVVLVVGGNPLPLSAPSQQKIAQAVEFIVRCSAIGLAGGPWGRIPLFPDYNPDQIKASGSYLHLVYPANQSLPLGRDLPPMTDVFLSLKDNPHGGSYPGYPGSIALVGSHTDFPTYFAHPSPNSGDNLIALGLNPDLYPHLPPQMKATVALVTAVKNGDLATLKNLLAQGADVKTIVGPEGSLLCYAATPAIAELLLQQGIPVDAKDNQRQTALLHICHDYMRDRASIAPVVSVLLKHGADPNSAVLGDSEVDALMLALDGPTVDALVAAGARVQDMMGAQEWADSGMSFRGLDYYQALARHGLDLQRGNQGLFLLLRACMVGGKDDVVEWLLNQGVDPNGVYPFPPERTDLPSTPLKQAAYSENANAAEILLRHGAKVDDDMVYLALDCGRSRVVKTFWDAGARPISELLYAVDQKEPIEELQKLLDKGIPADPPQDKHVSPLALAAYFGDLPAVQLLIGHGADVNRGDEQHRPLYLAASGIKKDVVGYLIGKGARADVADVEISLRRCYLRGHAMPPMEDSYAIVRQLVNAGAVKDLTKADAARLLAPPNGAGAWHDPTLTKIFLDAGLK